MAVTSATKSEVPRLCGVAEIAPLTLHQYQQMLHEGILGEDDPVEMFKGYLVSMDKGMGFDWPFGSMPPGVPRLSGFTPLWPLSLEQYHRMIKTAIVGEDDPIELIDGYLVAKDRGRGPGMGQGPTHSSGVTQASDRLRTSLSNTWLVRTQLPITLGTASGLGGREPEPDVTVAEGPWQNYTTHHPGPLEIRLLVEVADTSLATDRRVKAPLYASSGIERYWIVNLIDRQLEVYADPDRQTGLYRSQEILTENQSAVLTWNGLPSITVAVCDLLP